MDCIFCKIINGNIPSKKVYEDENILAFMDVSPICDGHTLIVPKKHVETILDVDTETLTNMFETAKKIAPMVMNKLNEKGFSLTINYGDKQSVKHLHMHIMPNYEKKPSKNYEEVHKIITE